MELLEEIKAKIAEYKGYLDEWDKWNHDNTTMGGRNAHEDLMCADLNYESYKYLTALLPVVEAAEEYRQTGGYVAMKKIFDALKALQATPESTGGTS